MSQFVDDEAIESMSEGRSGSEEGCGLCGEPECGCVPPQDGEQACPDLTRSDATVGFKAPMWNPYEEDPLAEVGDLEILAHASRWTNSLRCQEVFSDFEEREPVLPDLHAYFSQFPAMDWSDVVRLCRAHANFLQAQHQPRGYYKKHKTSNAPTVAKTKAAGKRVPRK